jgi:hypothetical protein
MSWLASVWVIEGDYAVRRRDVTASPLIGTLPATARASTSNVLTAECAGVYIAEKLGERRLALLERLAAEVSTVEFRQIEGT